MKTKMQTITCAIPIPEGYKFKCIDRYLRTGEFFIGKHNIVEEGTNFMSGYLWIVLEKEDI